MKFWIITSLVAIVIFIILVVGWAMIRDMYTEMDRLSDDFLDEILDEFKD